MTRNVLQPGEFMLKVTLPDDVADWTGSYRKSEGLERPGTSLKTVLPQHGGKAIGQH